MLIEMLSLSAGVFGFVFLLLLIVLIIRKPLPEVKLIHKSDLAKIKEQINRDEEI